MTPLLLSALALLAVALFVFCIEPLSILPVLERLTPQLTYRIPTSQPLVALSFDDGPHPIFTPQVLDILHQHNAQATFFLIGDRALRHPELVARIKAAGHEVANHYFTNGSLLFLRGSDLFPRGSDLFPRGSELQLRHSAIHRIGLQPLKKALDSEDEFVRNLQQTEQAIGIVGAQRAAPQSATNDPSMRTSAPPKFFRPPGGVARPSQLRLARAHGYDCMLGSAYPHDPMHPPVWYIRWLVTKNLSPGTIVILHDGISNPTRTIQVLPQILTAAHRKRLRIVSIGTLRASAEQPDVA
jgi:peptidoglycan-N-acetylglucosamine deacetylase